jgi:hypothetical protein
LAKTIGVDEVDALAASAETAPPVAKIVLTVRPAVFDRYVLALVAADPRVNLMEFWRRQTCRAVDFCAYQRVLPRSRLSRVAKARDAC